MAAPGSPANDERSRGTLTIVRPASPVEAVKFETFIKITADGSVTAYNGHVDLGTGIRTALGQIVAEELDVSFARVVVVLGDTSRVPNQGATIASETIQITAVPLRMAAAQARQFLITRAAERLELPPEDLSIEDGLVRGKDNRSVSYGELIAGDTIRLELADDIAVKDVGAYSIVGKSMPRVDLPAKATGELVYVHDVRLPGMLHGRVVRPPYAGVDAGPFVGTSLIAVDEASVRHIPGLIAVVHQARGQVFAWDDRDLTLAEWQTSSSTAGADEEWAIFRRRSLGQVALQAIPTQGTHGAWVHRNLARLAELGPTDGQHPVLEINVVVAQRQRLADPQPRGGDQSKQRFVDGAA